MRSTAILLVALSLGGLLAAGCQTYRQDLERAQHHYEHNEYEAALALFRVLEPDMDSFSPAEQSQYAYFRGMNDYRLASLAPQGSGVADPKKGYRTNARHWLGVAAAIEKVTPGSLNDDQKQRLHETVTDLDKDVFGGADTAPVDAPDGGAPAASADAPNAGSPAP
jgi:hypothetical protein